MKLVEDFATSTSTSTAILGVPLPSPLRPSPPTAALLALLSALPRHTWRQPSDTSPTVHSSVVPSHLHLPCDSLCVIELQNFISLAGMTTSTPETEHLSRAVSIKRLPDMHEKSLIAAQL
ncbi:hypothetical protein AC578_8047 [Pseudocercospora eumusae]|uniref:Uncharacterized protein n=1 Tax=Pseudocercospora eumusae TaxID=321146 RepID=A0A139GXE3_9PEZI|nr:hypothetical protein AC578_8047 [Pseudocercospora eumusae]